MDYYTRKNGSRVIISEMSNEHLGNALRRVRGMYEQLIYLRALIGLPMPPKPATLIALEKEYNGRFSEGKIFPLQR